MRTLVKCIHLCFVNGRRYRPGEIFELPEGLVPGSSMEVLKGEEAKNVPVETKPTRTKKSPAKEPETFSEITKRDAALDLGDLS